MTIIDGVCSIYNTKPTSVEAQRLKAKAKWQFVEAISMFASAKGVNF